MPNRATRVRKDHPISIPATTATCEEDNPCRLIDPNAHLFDYTIYLICTRRARQPICTGAKKNKKSHDRILKPCKQNPLRACRPRATVVYGGSKGVRAARRRSPLATAVRTLCRRNPRRPCKRSRERTSVHSPTPSPIAHALAVGFGLSDCFLPPPLHRPKQQRRELRYRKSRKG